MTNECACGLATMELVSNVKRVLDDIKEAERREGFLRQSAIDMIIGFTGKALENAEEIEKFCNVKLTKEKDVLKISQTNMRRIDYPYVKGMVKDNLENSVVSIRNTIHQCKTFNK